MKTIRVMSIIGIVWFSISLLCIITFYKDNSIDAAIGWDLMAVIYAIPYSIVGLVQSRKHKKNVFEENGD